MTRRSRARQGGRGTHTPPNEIWLGKPRELRADRPTGALALCYPNTYWVGMSSLGFQIVYESCWSHPGWVCERFFLPSRLEPKGRGLASQETGSALRDFDIVAFSVSFEGDYVNVVRMLAAGGIPLLRSLRSDGDPIVLAGGPAVTMNPLPLSDFFDAFVAGDGDHAIHEILDSLSSRTSAERSARVESLAEIEGVWVPGVSEWSTSNRRIARDLDASDLLGSSCILTDRTEFPNMVMAEVMRGCKRGCAFCLARQITSPFRLRSAESIVGSVMRRVDAAEGAGLGRKRVSVGLVGPAVSDHPEAAAICREFVGRGLRVSTSSLRLESLTEDLARALKEGGQRTITLAPEAGTERLRRAIRKPASDDEIFASLRRAADAGFSGMKLYFMFGLPTETDDDIEGIVDLCREVQRRCRFKRLRVSAAPFVPKPQTPFAAEPMQPRAILKGRARRLREGLRRVEGTSLAVEGITTAELQYILAHGGRSAGAALRRAALESEPILRSLKAVAARG